MGHEMPVTFRQEPLPGLEDYVCTFQCLTHCPFPDNCIWDDPQIGEPYQYPEFFNWQLEHLPAEQHAKLTELTPDSMDEFYPEPAGNVYRCPRCHSTNINFGEVWIICQKCGYNEPLIDFTENVGVKDGI